MIRLRQAHAGGRAVVIFGGPSLIAAGFDFARLRGAGCVTFLEAKALTPHILRSGWVPDYYLLLFPEKAKDNSLQHFVYRSMLAGVRIDGLLRDEHRQTARDIRDRFDELFERWRPHRGPHKQYRWRPDVYLADSPYDVLGHVPATRIITNRPLLDANFPHFRYLDRTFFFDQDGADRFDLEEYFTPLEQDGRVVLRGVGSFLNSASIALYPLLRYMGFREAYVVGMDMSMLGSLEYAAPYTFRSMVHFWWFFHRARRVFNANYKANGLLFRRPQSEFDDFRLLWREAPLKLTRVYEPWRYATPIDGVRTVSFDQFFDELG